MIHILDSIIRNPALLYELVKTKFKDTSILESLGECNNQTSRYSIIGVRPRYRLTSRNQECYLYDYQKEASKPVASWHEVLSSWVSINCFESEAIPLQTAAIGYIGYESCTSFEKAFQVKSLTDNPIYDVCLVKYDILFVLDRLKNKAYWISENSDNTIVDQIEEEYIGYTECENLHFHTLGDIEMDQCADSYKKGIRKTIEHICSGDIFQANITSRFSARYIGDPYYLYKILRNKTPNPFFAFLDFEFPVISTSPERFFNIKNNIIRSNPIKGTMPSTIDGQDQKSALMTSDKNRAENIMITDLVRNDIGRICEQHSVAVESECEVVKFNNVYHMESVVRGKLKKDVTLSNVLKSVFPAGSITGAPKIKSMEIINNTEPSKRGPYTGAIGVFGSYGWVDTCVAIRTLYFDKDRVYFHAGGGITASSDPDDEFQELKVKVKNIAEALDSTNVLSPCRLKLNELDEKIFELLNSRFRIVGDIADIKRKYMIPVLQSQRIEEIKKRSLKKIPHGALIEPEFVNDYYDLIINYSMVLEEKDTF